MQGIKAWLKADQFEERTEYANDADFSFAAYSELTRWLQQRLTPPLPGHPA